MGEPTCDVLHPKMKSNARVQREVQKLWDVTIALAGSGEGRTTRTQPLEEVDTSEDVCFRCYNGGKLQICDER